MEKTVGEKGRRRVGGFEVKSVQRREVGCEVSEWKRAKERYSLLDY